MTIRFKGIAVEDIVPEKRLELDLALDVTLNQQLDALGRDNPKDTGRMASSWTISKSGRSKFVRPEDWAARGEQRYERYDYRRKITFEGDWFILNNVPYADVICFDYTAKVPKASKDRLTWIANQTGNLFKENLRELRS